MTRMIEDLRHDPLLSRERMIVILPLLGLYFSVCALWAIEVDPMALAFYSFLPRFAPAARPR